jgi:hypothetical protein
MTKKQTLCASLSPALKSLVLIAALTLLGATVAYAGWNAPVPASPDSAGDVGLDTSLAVVADNPAISYYDWDNGNLKYVRATTADGSSWGTPVTVESSGDVGLYTSLVVVNGNPAISYYDNGSGDLKYVRANDSTGSSWGTPVTVESSGDVGMYTSLAVLTDGNPAISYYDNTNKNLNYARFNGSNWITDTVDSSGDVGEYTSLAVVNGNPAISYYDSNGYLKYVRAANADGSSWTTLPVTVDSAGTVGQDTSLAVVDGYPAISYYDNGNGYLKYVRAIDANGSSWGSPLTLDSAGTVGEYNSLAVVNGNPAISYYDRGNGDLKYIQATDAAGSNWGSPLTLDSAGTVGRYTSLEAVNGYPAVSYYDSTNDDLKYLYFIPAPEIAVLGNGALIATGDASPSLADNTMFLTPGETIAHTFTISNSGELDLTLTGSPVISITGPAAADFSVTAQPVAPVSADSSTTFQVSFAPLVAGTRAATLTIANNDPDEAPYEFALQGNTCSNAITVQNANDSGAGSLRQALADICDGGTIDFAADTAITLGSPLTVNRSVTLTGQTHTVTVSGNDAVRVFHVYTDTQVIFDNLTIAHGRTTTPEIGSSPTGGGVRIEAGAVVTLTNSALLSNTATYYDAEDSDYYGHGGGIYNLGALTVISATFADNVASGRTGDVNGDGGAIYNRGTLAVTSSEFTGNAAESGGAIYNRSGATLTVESSTISGNSAPCGGAGINSRGTATVSDSTIADNVVPGTTCGDSDAAGIGNTGTMTVSRSTISGNINEGGSGGGLSSSGSNPDQGRLTVMDSTIYNNTADDSGGGIYNWWDSVLTVTNCSIYSNTATYYGGGILSGPHINTRLTLINSTFSYNTAQDGAGLYNGSPGYSGAVLAMVNSTVVSNTATTGSGGGFYNFNSANVTLDNVILWGNSAATSGPQMYRTPSYTPTISYCDIEGSGGSTSWDTNLGTDGGGNLDQDPKLGPLADNGGDTLTYALLSGSPAIDHANAALCPTTDQRGVTRPQGSGCDMGAYESGPSAMAVTGHGVEITNGASIPATANDTDFGSVTLGQALTHTFTISNSGGEILNLTGTPVVSITGPAAANFTVMAQPVTPVDPGQMTTFALRFTPSVTGTRAATVTIANDDSGENPYDFAVQGAGAAGYFCYLPSIIKN